MIEESRPPARRDPASHVVAGFLAAAALFAGLVAIIYYPGRVGPGAILVALIAAAMGGFQSRLATIAVAGATGGRFLGMVLAIVLERPIF